MGKETERKFLIKERSFLQGHTGTPIVQGYCSAEDARVKVRLHLGIGTLILTTQGDGIFSRDYRFTIPLVEAMDLLDHYTLEEACHLVNGEALREGTVKPDMCRRIRLAGDKGFFTLKGTQPGLTRPEFEYALSPFDAKHLIEHHCSLGILYKTRYEVPVGTHLFEIDIFEGGLQGLEVAEIELAFEDQLFNRPEWLGVEVSRDRRYANAQLAASQQIPATR